MQKAPKELPAELSLLLKNLSEGWVNSPDRPKVRPEIVAAWDKLLDDWIADRSIPLLVRKGSEKGVVHECENRKVISTDNSPAQWVYRQAVEGNVQTLNAIRSSLIKDVRAASAVTELIPIAYARTKVHSDDSNRYQATLTKETDLNSKGWKLAHIEGVGLKTRTPISSLLIADVEEHFRKLMSPANMFVIPLQWAGVAETDEMLDAMRRARNSI